MCHESLQSEPAGYLAKQVRGNSTRRSQLTPLRPKKGSHSLLSHIQVDPQRHGYPHNTINHRTLAGDCLQSIPMVMMNMMVLTTTNQHLLGEFYPRIKQTQYPLRKKALSPPKVTHYAKNTQIGNTSAGCALTEVTALVP